MDLAGPSKTQSLGKASYSLVFVDDFTRYAEIRFLNKKSDAVKALKEICQAIFNCTGSYPKIIRTDRGSEFVNQEWFDYCSSHGIIHETTAASSHESVGAVERYNQILQSMCRPALADKPPFLWAEAFNWATHLKNRLPHAGLEGKTPYELLYQEQPSIKHFWPFWSKCYIHLEKEK